MVSRGTDWSDCDSDGEDLKPDARAEAKPDARTREHAKEARPAETSRASRADGAAAAGAVP